MRDSNAFLLLRTLTHIPEFRDTKTIIRRKKNINNNQGISQKRITKSIQLGLFKHCLGTTI